MMNTDQEKKRQKLSMAELNRLSPEEYRDIPKLPIVLVLDNIRSCHNIGSFFRTADALLVEKLLLCGITATPPDKEIHKTALDAEKTVAWEYFTDTLEAICSLVNNGYEIYAVEQVKNSISLPAFNPGKDAKIALVFGNEVKGVGQEVINRCSGAIEIPQYGTKHSFNVSVSAGIVVWEIAKKFLPGIPDGH